MCIFRDKIVVGPKGKKRFAQGLGFTLEDLTSHYPSKSYAGIYFDLRQAKLIQKRITKLVKEMEKHEL